MRRPAVERAYDTRRRWAEARRIGWSRQEVSQPSPTGVSRGRGRTQESMRAGRLASERVRHAAVAGAALESRYQYAVLRRTARRGRHPRGHQDCCWDARVAPLVGDNKRSVLSREALTTCPVLPARGALLVWLVRSRDSTCRSIISPGRTPADVVARRATWQRVALDGASRRAAAAEEKMDGTRLWILTLGPDFELPHIGR